MNLKKAVVAVVVVAGLAAGGWYAYHNYWSVEERPDALKLYGNVDVRQVRLAFFATGRIQRLTAQEGDRVQSGRVLGELSSSRYRANLAQAKAKLAQARENLAILETGTRPESIEKAEARVEAAQARLEEARVSYQRIQSLYESGSVSEQKRDDAETAYQTARAELDRARQALTLAREGPRDEKVAAARAKVEAAEAAVRLAEDKLEDTKLKAPDQGVIQQRILEVGDMASPQTPVFTLALTDPIWVRAYLPEPSLGKIQPGHQAEITTDSYPDRVYQAWVGYISPTAEFTPKHVQTERLRTQLVYQVRIHACNPRGQLRLGMPVTVRIPYDQPAPTPEKTRKDPCRED